MNDFPKSILLAILVLSVMLGGIAFTECRKKAELYNRLYGLHVTPSDVFWGESAIKAGIIKCEIKGGTAEGRTKP